MECTEKKYQWIKVDPEKCVGCSLCIDYCPRDVLRLNDDNIASVAFRDDCWYCDVCTFVCPVQALTVEEVPYLIK